MSKQFKSLISQYNTRMQWLSGNLAEEVSPKFERSVLESTLELYEDMLLQARLTKINYALWYETIKRFYAFPALINIDPDEKLLKIANRMFNCPDMIDYFKEYVDTGTELDVTQLATMVKRLKFALNLA